jgi:UDP-N-acetylmuramate dehydrogenase
MRWGARWWHRERDGDGDGDGARVVCASGASTAARPPMSLPAGIERDFPLSRLATVRTGGVGELFARAGSDEQLLELLAWAGASGVAVNVVGSGSNLLIADEGVPGLVVKLDRDLAAISVDGPRVRCGGGARLPAVAARAARAGLSGIEFGVNIPGTVGGAVRMNANAYGGELESALEWVQIATASGIQRRTPGELGFSYRHSNLADGEIVAHASLLLSESQPEAVRATLEQMRRRRHEAQPQGIKTFGSTFKNPDDPRAQGRSAGLLLADAGCNGLAIGGARFAPKHANFIENTGSATTADVIAVMVEGRRRVLERFGVELEPEVQTLGDVRFPWLR